MSFDERVLNGMSVLSAIVQNGTFAGAGRSLNMTQSGVSRAMARLEARMGTRLLERTTRSVVLTDDGRRLYEQVVPLLTGLEDAVASVAEGKAVVRGRLRVNIHPFFAQLILGPQLRKFLEGHPELQLEMITREQMGDMVAEGFDLAIRFGTPRPSTHIARKLLDTRIVTVATPGYIKRRGKPHSPEELNSGGHTLIDFRDPEASRPFQWEFHKGRKMLGVATGGQLMVSDVLTMHRICLSGYGIAQVMELGCENLLASGQLIELFPDWSDENFPLYALYPSRSHLPAKTRAFLEFVVSLIQRTATVKG